MKVHPFDEEHKVFVKPCHAFVVKQKRKDASNCAHWILIGEPRVHKVEEYS